MSESTSEPLIGAHVGPWRVNVTRPSTDPADGRAVTTNHVVIASCREEAEHLAIEQASISAGAPIEPETATLRSGRICG